MTRTLLFLIIPELLCRGIDSVVEGNWRRMKGITGNSPGLINLITDILDKKNGERPLFPGGISGSATDSAVLFPLSGEGGATRPSKEPCIIFNKRSLKVKQPGDLCFPGGRVSPILDLWISKLLTLPFFPIARWSYWSRWRIQRPRQARRLALLFATSLRESFEEMRLNPMGVNFLGPLPSQSLVMFDRVIYPMVAWIPRQRRFFPNWEVEKIVYIPLKNLLNAGNYACYRLNFEMYEENPQKGGTQDFPCFVHEDNDEKEVLWGTTYRIVMVFLDLIFGFRPPDTRLLPVVHGSLNANYYVGA